MRMAAKQETATMKCIRIIVRWFSVGVVLWIVFLAGTAMMTTLSRVIPREILPSLCKTIQDMYVMGDERDYLFMLVATVLACTLGALAERRGARYATTVLAVGVALIGAAFMFGVSCLLSALACH